MSMHADKKPLDMTDAQRCDEIVSLRAEVERLRKKNAKSLLDSDAVDFLAECESRADRAEAEVERLRERIFGRLLLPSEIAEFAAAADSDYCLACGLKWGEHRVYCEGSAAGRGEEK